MRCTKKTQDGRDSILGLCLGLSGAILPNAGEMRLHDLGHLVEGAVLKHLSKSELLTTLAGNRDQPHGRQGIAATVEEAVSQEDLVWVNV